MLRFDRCGRRKRFPKTKGGDSGGGDLVRSGQACGRLYCDRIQGAERPRTGQGLHARARVRRSADAQFHAQPLRQSPQRAPHRHHRHAVERPRQSLCPCPSCSAPKMPLGRAPRRCSCATPAAMRSGSSTTSARLLARRVDGIVILGRTTNPRPSITAGIPVPVVYAYAPSDSPDDSSFTPDNYMAGRLAVEHLLDRGRSSIALINGEPSYSAATDRAAGARDAMAERGLTLEGSDGLYGQWTESWGRRCTATLLASGRPIDGIVAASDQIARGVLDHLREVGLRVPEDVAVIGMDNWDILAQSARPPLELDRHATSGTRPRSGARAIHGDRRCLPSGRQPAAGARGSSRVNGEHQIARTRRPASQYSRRRRSQTSRRGSQHPSEARRSLGALWLSLAPRAHAPRHPSRRGAPPRAKTPAAGPRPASSKPPRGPCAPLRASAPARHAWWAGECAAWAKARATCRTRCDAMARARAHHCRHPDLGERVVPTGQLVRPCHAPRRSRHVRRHGARAAGAAGGHGDPPVPRSTRGRRQLPDRVRRPCCSRSR